ncbi:MAG: SlyX family protein [Xanthomonadales bacterium]
MTAAASNGSERLDDLEARLAFQDDLIERLNDVVARQDREIVALGQRLRALEKRLADLDETAVAGSAGGHEVPPHY